MLANENKVTGVIFFDIKLLLQPDVVFDSESNGCNCVGGIIFYQIFFDIIKFQTFLHRNGDISRNLGDEIDKN